MHDRDCLESQPNNHQPNNIQTAIKVQVRAQKKKCHCTDNLRLSKIDYNGQQLSMDCLNLVEWLSQDISLLGRSLNLSVFFFFFKLSNQQIRRKLSCMHYKLSEMTYYTAYVYSISSHNIWCQCTLLRAFLAKAQTNCSAFLCSTIVIYAWMCIHVYDICTYKVEGLIWHIKWIDGK